MAPSIRQRSTREANIVSVSFIAATSGCRWRVGGFLGARSLAWTTPPFASGPLLLEPQRPELSLWKPLLWLWGEPAGGGHRGQGWGASSRGRDGALRPSWLGVRTSQMRTPLGGWCPQEQPSTGQVQIVLKHTDELGSGGAKEFRISAESHFVHFYCSCPIKTQLLRVIVVLGAAVKGSRPQTSPDLPN